MRACLRGPNEGWQDSLLRYLGPVLGDESRAVKGLFWGSSSTIKGSLLEGFWGPIKSCFRGLEGALLRGFSGTLKGLHMGGILGPC